METKRFISTQRRSTGFVKSIVMALGIIGCTQADMKTEQDTSGSIQNDKEIQSAAPLEEMLKEIIPSSGVIPDKVEPSTILSRYESSNDAPVAELPIGSAPASNVSQGSSESGVASGILAQQENSSEGSEKTSTGRIAAVSELSEVSGVPGSDSMMEEASTTVSADEVSNDIESTEAIQDMISTDSQSSDNEGVEELFPDEDNSGDKSKTKNTPENPWKNLNPTCLEPITKNINFRIPISMMGRGGAKVLSQDNAGLNEAESKALEKARTTAVDGLNAEGLSICMSGTGGIIFEMDYANGLREECENENPGFNCVEKKREASVEKAKGEHGVPKETGKFYEYDGMRTRPQISPDDFFSQVGQVDAYSEFKMEGECTLKIEYELCGGSLAGYEH